MTAKEKIDKILSITGLELTQFAIECKIIPNTLKVAIKRNALSPEIVTKIHDRFNVRKEFLRTGNEPVFEENVTSVQNGSDNKENPLGEDLDDETMVLQRALRGESIYRVVPASILEDAVLMPASELRRIDGIYQQLLEAKDQMIRMLEDELGRRLGAASAKDKE